VRGILVAAGVVEGAAGPRDFGREDGSHSDVVRRARMFEDRSCLLDDRLVVQVSRWDVLKDPIGVMRGFVDHVLPHADGHLVLAGPAVEAVADDPEGSAVLEQTIAAWSDLPADARARVHLATLPMEDGEENAAIVNALQRHATVVVQKSLAEGFGLTVAEAMWKGRPVVASRIGGIQDQIENGKTGLLVDDPRDLAEFGRAVTSLLKDPDWARQLGRNAQENVRDRFLGPRHLLEYAALAADLLRGEQ
jgi:trehalose synthase